MTTTDEKLKRMPRTVRVGVVAGGLSEFITVQAAINWCATQAVPAPSATTPYTVEIWPGIYDEQIAGADFVHLKGIGPEGAVIISQADDTILFPGDNAEYNNITWRLTTPTAARTMIQDALANTSTFDRCRFEITTPAAWGITVFDLPSACTLAVKRCYAALAGTGGSIFFDSNTGAGNILLENNNFIWGNVNAYMFQIVGVNTGVIGGGNVWDGTCGWMSCNNGTLLLSGDSVLCSGAMNIVGGSVCLKNGRQQYEVYDGMWIQHSITAALADTPVPAATVPYTVFIHPGYYNEKITMGASVYLKGVGKGAAIIYQVDDDDIITLVAGYQEVENLTIRMVTPGQARTLVNDGGVVSNCSFERVRFEIETPGAFAHVVFQHSGGGTHTFKHCYSNIASGIGTFQFFVTDTNPGHLILIGNDITIDQGDMIAVSIAATTMEGGQNRWGGANATLFNVSASGTIRLDQDANLTGAACVANLANSTVLMAISDDHYEVWPGMQIQHALNAINANGGKVQLRGYGIFALTAQVLRAIDNVTIVGMGLATRVTLDGVTPVITAGTQAGWQLKDFDVDAGLVSTQFATNSTLHNITINGLHATIINPDVGVTRFPGQPVLRTDEDRPLNPTLTVIRKDFTQREYQLYNPTFATPQFIMELLTRQARYHEVPINSLWTANHGGTGGGTLYPTFAEVSCAAAGGDHGLFNAPAVMLNSYVDGVNWDRADFDNRLIIAFDVSRDAGTHADINARVQLKQAAGEGILANDGLGIEIQNYQIWGEAFAAAQGTVDLGITMTALYTYRIMIVLIPNVGVYFYVNDVYRGVITAQIPTGPAAGNCYWVISIDNGAQAVACVLRCSTISYWNHL